MGKTGSETLQKFCRMENEIFYDEPSECGLRPVFILNSGIKILSGSGTLGDPYELGL